MDESFCVEAAASLPCLGGKSHGDGLCAVSEWKPLDEYAGALMLLLVVQVLCQESRCGKLRHLNKGRHKLNNRMPGTCQF